MKRHLLKTASLLAALSLPVLAQPDAPALAEEVPPIAQADAKAKQTITVDEQTNMLIIQDGDHFHLIPLQHIAAEDMAKELKNNAKLRELRLGAAGEVGEGVAWVEIEKPPQVDPANPNRAAIKARRIELNGEDKGLILIGKDGRRVFLHDGQALHENPLELNADTVTLNFAEAQGGDPQAQAAKPATVRAPFLGVNAEPLDLETAKALGLKRSTGLLVSHSPSNGPAGNAGLKKGDVLTKFNDQILVNAEQFAVLVRSQKIGDMVTLHGLRDGKPIELKAKLGEADVTPLGPGGSALEQEWRLQFSPMLGPVGSPLRPEIEIAPGLWVGDGWGGLGQNGDDGEAVPEQLLEMMKKMQRQMLQQREDLDERMQQLRQQLDLDIQQLRGDIQIPQGDGAAQKQLQATMMWSDGQHKIRISHDNGKAQITIKDREANVLYDGALPEDGQVDGLPDEVQNKVDQLTTQFGDTELKPAADTPKPASEISEQEGLNEGHWGYWSDGDYILKLTWNGEKQEMKIYAQHFAPWWLDTIEDFRVDPKWQKGETDKLHVKAFDRLSDDMQTEIYAMLNHKEIKQKLVAEGN